MSSLDNDDWGLIRHFGARDVDELMAFRVGGGRSVSDQSSNRGKHTGSTGAIHRS